MLFPQAMRAEHHPHLDLLGGPLPTVKLHAGGQVAHDLLEILQVHEETCWHGGRDMLGLTEP